MATVFDAAAYIMAKLREGSPGGVTAWKLQKLVYYSQAWSSVWDDSVLFEEPIEAWANGPVCPELYNTHRGSFKIERINGDASQLSTTQKETIDQVLNYYGDKTAQFLSELTHAEQPWIDARKGLSPGERGNNEIKLDDMALYYGGLYDESSKTEATSSKDNPINS